MAHHFSSVFFIKTAMDFKHLPSDSGREVAFVGASNVGKSSVLNTLTQHKKLARVSKTPGRTQGINYFSVTPDESIRLADLPGYGYAKVPKAVQARWSLLIERYFQERRSLKALVLIMDIRHPFKPLDVQLLEWALESGILVHVLLNKSDKLGFGAGKNILLKARETFKMYGDTLSCQRFSALKNSGIDELSTYLDGVLFSEE